MCFITIELRHQCDRTVTRNCDSVTHNYEKKIAVTIQKSSLCFNPSQFFFIFGSSSNANLVQLRPFILCHCLLLMNNDRLKNDYACSSIFLKYFNAYTSYKSTCQSHLLTVHTSSDFEKNFVAK